MKLETATIRFAPALALLLCIGYLSLSSIERLIANSDWVAHTLTVQKTLSDTVGEIESFEAATRGYAATGDEKFIGSLKSGRERLDKDIENLEQFTIESARQQERIVRLKKQIHEKLAFNLDIIHMRKDRNADGAVQRLASGDGREIMNRIRKTIGEMVDDENALYAARDGQVKRDTRTATMLIAGGAAGAMAILILAMIFMNRDIAARRQAESKLSRALEDTASAKGHLDAMIQAVSSGLILTDLDNRIVLLNKAAVELLHIDATAAVGQPIDSTIANTVLKNKIKSARTKGEVAAKFDCVVSEDDTGPRQVLHAGVAAIVDAKGAVIGAITVLDDVSKERQVDRMKSEFLSTAAHELRTPLTSIRGFSELLLSRNFTEEKKRSILQIVNTQATNLANIVNDLLDLARLESGQGLTLRRSPTDLTLLAKNVVEMFSGPNPRHHYALETDNARYMVYCDPQKIQQVFQNLVSNATKYSPNGGDVRIRLAADGLNVSCTVTDHGIGMTSEHVARIFTKFFRADASNTAAEGTGLGMSIVKAIVEQHGGTIGIDSEPGKGTRVCFTLRRHGELVETPAKSEMLPPLSNTRRILILEDDMALVSMMRLCFEHAGFEVFSSGCVSGFIDLAAELKPDLVCMDCILPDGDGLEIAAQLRRDQRTRQIPFIFVSVRESEKDRGMAAGAQAFVSKPFTEREIVGTVKEVLNSIPARQFVDDGV